ncbi:RNA polymerase sigma factor SigJ [Paenibacillus arenilitoris]|uniref:RNA polymerase sigma factor SigJ n=1 Tax=Paenibacillus arenilitoris TaxID=2772299 RepID=A0A927CSV1_9BACL|nr:RNA polymerase sigma factor SigJ [Paenibacillus arenilitoris]MBD2872820.1 RNA polymerase sigma factor SigJ [Paenibacillus arenilitoris]
MQKLYEQYRRLLFTLAYQLTGSAADAEDAVQDVFVKVHGIDPGHLNDPKAYLCKMVTNRCLDMLSSARKRRERYFGEWLPEPVPTVRNEPLEAALLGERLSYAMLVLLERLSPAERAAFVLREALGFDYPAIAELTGKNEANCRKLLSRAKGKLGMAPEESPRAEAADEAWVRRLLAALGQGDAEAVVSMLAEDVVLLSDGGGKAVAAVHPIETPDRVAKFLLGLMRKLPDYIGGVRFETRPVNGQTGLLVRSKEGIDTAVLLHVDGGKIRNLYFIRNPDKLERLSGEEQDFLKRP